MLTVDFSIKTEKSVLDVLETFLSAVKQFPFIFQGFSVSLYHFYCNRLTCVHYVAQNLKWIWLVFSLIDPVGCWSAGLFLSPTGFLADLDVMTLTRLSGDLGAFEHVRDFESFDSFDSFPAFPAFPAFGAFGFVLKMEMADRWRESQLVILISNYKRGFVIAKPLFVLVRFIFCASGRFGDLEISSRSPDPFRSKGEVG